MKPQLFLADDNPIDAMLLDLGFTDAGRAVEIVQALDGALAYDLLVSAATSKPFRFSLIVIDLNIPGLKGLELLKKLNVMPELNGVPKVIMTTSLAPEDRERSLRLNPSAYLIKPDGYKGMFSVIEVLVPYLFPNSPSRPLSA